MKKTTTKLKLLTFGTIPILTLTAANQLFAQNYVSSNNGYLKTMAVDRYANPGPGVTEVFNMTGSFFDGTTWSLQMADLNMGDGLESAAQNIYNKRYDVSGARHDYDAAGLAPWNSNNEQFRNSWDTVYMDNIAYNRSYFRAYGDYSLAATNANFIPSESQSFTSPTSYSFTFSQPVQEIYMYIQDLDDAMIYGFNHTPTIVQTSLETIWGGPEGNAGLKGQLTYHSGLNAIHDADGKGEGLAYGSAGLQFAANMDHWNPSSAGVIKFSDVNGISQLNFNVAGLDPSIDGNLGENSDGFIFTLAIPVPEPSSAFLCGFLGLGFLGRRSRK